MQSRRIGGRLPRVVDVDKTTSSWKQDSRRLPSTPRQTPSAPPRAPSSTTMMLNLRDNWSLATKTHWATNASLNSESFSL